MASFLDPLEDMLAEALPAEVFNDVQTRKDLYLMLMKEMLARFGIKNPDISVMDFLKFEFRNTYFLSCEGSQISLIEYISESDESNKGAWTPKSLQRQETKTCVDKPRDHVPKQSSDAGSATSNSNTTSSTEHQVVSTGYFMSGALLDNEQQPRRNSGSHQHLKDYVHPCNDDALVCDEKFSQQVQYMPFRIIDMDELQTFTALSSPRMREAFGEDFLTTPLGMARAEAEIQSQMGQRGWSSEALWGALMLRGGRIPDAKKSCAVIYPEDIVPCVPDGFPGHDREYWSRMAEQGRVWTEIWDL